MSVPVCCGKRATFYHKVYPDGHSWEEGYRCKKCGRTRINTIDPERDARMKIHMDSLDAIREEGMKFDAELARKDVVQVPGVALQADPEIPTGM